MKKLKYQYQTTKKRQRTKYIWVIYPNIRNSVFRHFSTKQEKSFYFLHLIEYQDYPLKLRLARGKGLADPWDDLPTSVYAVAKSWKHNSKRKQQYYKESEPE